MTIFFSLSLVHIEINRAKPVVLQMINATAFVGGSATLLAGYLVMICLISSGYDGFQCISTALVTALKAANFSMKS